MKEFEGRAGIVTGGSSGIGYAIANTLAQAGAKVYAISRSGAVKSGMAPSAEGVIHVRGDVTDGARMAEIIREIGEKEGLDFLVNDAGITQKHRAEVLSDGNFRADFKRQRHQRFSSVPALLSLSEQERA